jgi:putative ABC transport system permease protein
MASRLRSIFAGSGLLAWRRARRDAALVLVWTVLLAVSAGVAVAAPRFLVDTVDDAAREAVAEAGTNADLIATTDVGASQPNRAPTAPPSEMGELADQLRDNLPPGYASAYSDTTITVLGPRSVVDGDTALDIRVGMLTPDITSAITVVDGTLPEDVVPAEGEPLPIVVSSAASSASQMSETKLTVGTQFDLPASNLGIDQPVPVVVAAIVDAVDADAPLWIDLPDLWTAPNREYRGGGLVAVIPLATPSVVAALSESYSDPFKGTFRMQLDPTVFTGALVAQVSEEERAMRANVGELTSSISYPIVVSKSFSDALEGFAEQARAAVAQLSLIIAGVLGVAATVLVLTSRLLVLRRRPELALERARGSSTLATVVRTLPQSVVTTALAVAVVFVILPGPLLSPAILAIVAAIGLLAEPLNTLVLTRSTRTARRAPANRQDRAVIATRARTRRIAIEVTVVALAGAALVSFVARGLLQNQTTGIDPLLSAAPILVAAAVTIVVVRLYPLPVRVIASLAQRSRGIHGLMGSVRARRAIAVLPLLALTIATGLAATNALLDDTVQSGQEAASWQQVGADLRITTELDDAQRDTIATAPDVSSTTSFATLRESRVELGTNIAIVTALAIDEQYADVLAGLPGEVNTSDFDELFGGAGADADAGAGDGGGDGIPALVDSDVASRALNDTIVMNVDQQNVTLRIVGTFDAPESGYLQAPLVYVPFDALNTQLEAQRGSPVVADTTLALGSGVDDAAASAGVASGDIVSRATWLRDQRDGSLVGGVQTGITISTIAVALFAVIGLLATVAAGTRERARTLSLLRTLGTPSRFGWWLALSDLAPLVIAALLGGVIAGGVVAAVLFPSLGISALTGAAESTPLVVAASSIVPIILGGVALVLVAIIAEVLMHRRDRLNEVLRVGETV